MGKRRIFRSQQRPFQIHRRRRHWNPLTGGLPTFAQGGLGRIGIAIAPTDPNRMYALVEARGDAGGVYRSDDAGANWKHLNSEQRIYGRGSDFACVRVDPKNKDVIYVANTSMYRSDDAGQSFTAIKGAPGGDDYHTIWINPLNPDIILLAADQGATITVNRGRTWSSWYNQPTAQFYHVNTDNQTPYWVYGGQQESGSAGVASRGNDGQITFRDWRPVGADEYGYVAPDPLNPNIIYGSKGTKFNRITGEVEHVNPRGNYRYLRTAPLLFSYVDPHVLYLGAQVVLKTTDGGKNWEAISPDLTRELRPPGQRRVLRRCRQTAGHPPRSGLRDRPIAPQRQRPLGGHRRWSDPPHARRRRELEEHHPARHDALEQGGATRCLSLR